MSALPYIFDTAQGTPDNPTPTNIQQILQLIQSGGSILGPGGSPLQFSESGDPTNPASWTFNGGDPLSQLLSGYSNPITTGTTGGTGNTGTMNASPGAQNIGGWFNTPNVTNPLTNSGMSGAYQPVQFSAGQQYLNVPGTYNAGGSSIGSALVNLVNQAQNQAQFGQTGMNDALQWLQGYESSMGGNLASMMGQTEGVMGNLPASVNWAGQAATGDLSTQNQLVQALLGQTLPSAQTLQGNMGQALTTPASNILNQVGTEINSPLQTVMGTAGLGLNPATSAALQTQAMDQTAQGYNNAKQSVLTQLLAQGATGGGAANAGASSQQMLTDLGTLSNAQQAQQSNLMQQGILANQSQINTNNQLSSGAANILGQLGGQYTGLTQNAFEANQQLGLGASQLTGGLASQLGGLYNSGALGFGNLTNSYYGTSEAYPQPYLSTVSGGLNELLSGAQNMGQLGINGITASGPLMASAVASTAPGSTNALIGAGLGALGTILGGYASNPNNGSNSGGNSLLGSLFGF